MSRLVPVRSQVMVRILEQADFQFVRQRGSHAFYRHPDGRATVVPMHRGDLPKGTIREIIRDTELSVDEYDRLRREV